MVFRRAYGLILLVLIVALSGCAQIGLKIDNNLTVCCPGNYDEYSTYRLQTENMPQFLSSWVVDMFDATFAERGMQRNDQSNDLIVTLSYNHVTLIPEQAGINPFVRRSSPDVELRYIAVINISMRESRSNEEVWAAQVSRIHTVSPGEYMHEGGARNAFRETFRDVLIGYPGGS